MNMRTLCAAAIATAMSTVMTGAAEAAPVTFEITTVFGGGDTGLSATGTFDYDPTTNEFSNINLTTPDGTILGGNYIVATPGAGDTVLNFTSTTDMDLTGANFLRFGLSGSLTDLANGVVDSLSVIFGFEAICQEATCPFPGFGQDTARGFSGASSVTLSEVPLPGAAWLFLAGAGGLIARRRAA